MNEIFIKVEPTLIRIYKKKIYKETSIDSFKPFK